jgi:hypothetical protein
MRAAELASYWRLLSLVILGEHEGEHSRGDLRVGRVLGAEFRPSVVVVDFPEEFAAYELEAAESCSP